MDLSYSHRLELVEKLGNLFPGKIYPLGFKQKKLGYFAGIYLQTKWQQESGRDKLPIWYLVNHSLTLSPFKYAQEYLEHPVKDTSQVWKIYFKTGKLKDMWKAHTTSIRFALHQHEEELERTQLSPFELAFWQGWIRFVFSCESWVPPLNDYLLKLPLSLTMPRSILNNPSRNPFIKWLSRDPLPQKEFLQTYARLVEYT